MYSIIENPNVHEFRTFFIEIKTNPEEPEIVSRIIDIPRVRAIDGIIGQSSLMVKFCTRNDQQFAEILKQIDTIITGTRFQHYKIINCLKTFKDGGKGLAEGKPAIMKKSTGRHDLDGIDESLLDAMQDIPERFSYEWITAKASIYVESLSYSQVHRRVKEMIDSGVIESVTIKLSPDFIPKTDFPVKFYLQVLPKQLSEYNGIAAGILSSRHEIVELYRTGEEYGLFAVVRTGSIAEYRKFLESLYATGKIQDTISTLVIDEKLPATFKPFKDDGAT